MGSLEKEIFRKETFKKETRVVLKVQYISPTKKIKEIESHVNNLLQKKKTKGETISVKFISGWVD